MIILEGTDGSGKSTLAKQLGLPIEHPGAPPKDATAESTFFRSQQNKAGRPIVFDRVTCVSQQVYRKRMFDERYMKPLRSLIGTPHCIVVYCRPPDEVILNLDNHTVAEHDTPEMLQLVKDNADLFVKSYDRLMATIPHVVYDFTKSDLQSFMMEIIPTQYHRKEWVKCMNLLKAMRVST